MDTSKQKICRLCLNVDDNKYTLLDASAIGKVKAIVPELVLQFPNDSVICSKCRNIVEKSFELKRTFSKNNDLIQTEKNKSNATKVDLNSIVNVGNAKSIEDICRICLKHDEGKYVCINKESDDDFNNVLEYCVPELDANLTLNPAICSSCQTLLYEMYNFKKEWLSIEEKIRSCSNCITDGIIDLNKVLILTGKEEENDFLSGFEVQDEEGTDIFDNIPNQVEENYNDRKRPISQAQQPSTQTKKHKLITDEITDEELPTFHFDSNLLYNPIKSDVMVEDWLARVEEYKRKFNWSDYTTIHKVLVKLTGMKELYIWFSNIADIMDWEQWKKKLMRAFPRRTDYHIHVKKMIVRRKKREETYVSYYGDKLKLMEPLNLTNEQKVSCIFGGITDVLVCCVGRVGDYKTPEELLDYFKSCDDKHSVQAAAANKDTKPAAKPKGQTQSTPPGAQKKFKQRCFNCLKYGHSAAECYRPKVGGQPMPGSAPIDLKVKKIPKKAKLNVKCFRCGNSGHVANACKLTDNMKLVMAAQQMKAQAQKKPGFETCVKCHQTGHTIANCWSKKKGEKQRNGASPRGQKQNKGAEEPWTQCLACGQFGNRENPCCPARSRANDKYIGSYYPDNNERQICLRCYKTGHSTKSCREVPHKQYRN